MKKLVVFSALAAVIVGLALAADRAETPTDPALAAVLERFDRVQESIRTLTADLTMTTRNRLLKEPMVYRGRFYMTTPDAVRWEFDTPEQMRFVIANDEYVGYYPDRKKAERKNIQRWSRRLFRYFGLGQGSDELSKFYRISLGKAPADDQGDYLLILEPKKRRAKKRVDEVRFSIDRETMLPVRIEYRADEDDVRIVEFDRMRVNVELAGELYRIDLPPDVEVTTGFTAFGDAAGS